VENYCRQKKGVSRLLIQHTAEQIGLEGKNTAQPIVLRLAKENVLSLSKEIVSENFY